MTKKILAAFLAMLMVVSLLPTSVGAVVHCEPEDCPVVLAFGDKGHSIANCEAAEVTYTYIKTVEAKCGQNGYKEYECDACGTHFGSDIVWMDEHIADPELTVWGTPATCTEPGKATVYTCATCGDKYTDDVNANPITFAIPALGHSFDEENFVPDYDGSEIINDCTKGIIYCTRRGCDATKEIEAHEEHEWDYENAWINKAPTCNDAGEVEVPCAHPFCEKTKKVAMLKQEDLHNGQLKKVSAVEGDCDTEEVVEHYECKVCGKLYADKNGTTPVEEDDVYLGFQHSDIRFTYNHPEADCLNWGYVAWFCDDCGYAESTDPIPPTGHSKLPTDENDYTYLAPTCSADGYYKYTCTNENCPLLEDDDDTNDLVTIKLNKLGHGENEKWITKVTVPATCQLGAYSFLICKDPNCATAGDLRTSVTENGKDYPVNVVVAGSRVIYTNEAVNCVDVNPVANSRPDSKNHIVNVSYTNGAPACGVSTLATYTCADCAAVSWETIVRPAHKFTVKEEVVAPSCQANGYTIYSCANEGCEETEERDETELNSNYVYTKFDDVLVAHPGLDVNNIEVIQAVTCEKDGAYKSVCADCGKDVAWTLVKTGHSEQPETLLGVGCTEDKYYICENFSQNADENSCSLADGKVVVTKKLNSHTTKKTAGTKFCDKDGVKEHYTCTVCGIIFWDNAATQPVDLEANEDALVEPATGHDTETVYTRVDGCVIDGFVYVRCTNAWCNKTDYKNEWTIDFDPMDGHSAAPAKTSADYKKLDATCDTEGYDYYICTGDNCSEDGNVIIIEGTVVPATKHKNAAGILFVDSCVDTTVDRVCKNAGCVYNTKNNPVPAENHKDVVQEYYDATCTEDGYFVSYCANGCEELNYISFVSGSMGHMHPLCAVGSYLDRIPTGEAIPADSMAELDYALELFDGDLKAFIDYIYEVGGIELNISAYTPATYLAAGSITYTCLDCEADVTATVAFNSVDFTVEVDNAVVPGADTYKDTVNLPVIGEYEYVEFIPVDGNIIAVDIYMSAYQQNFYGMQFNVWYNADSMNFLGYKNQAADKFGIMDAHSNIDEDYPDEGYVTVFAQSENSDDKGLVDVAVTGTLKLATLYFQLEAYYEYTYKDQDGEEVVDYDYDHYAYVYLDEIEVIDTEYEYKSVNGDSLSFDFVNALDFNWDGYVTVADAVSAYEILLGKSEYTYDSSIDVDNDGTITAKDVQALYDYIVGRIGDLEVYKLNNWTAPEGYVAAK